MKRATALITLLAVLVLLPACGASAPPESDATALEIWEDINTQLPEGSFPRLMELDQNGFEDFYSLTDKQVSEFVAYIPMMNVKATEIVIIKAVSGKAGDVEAAMKLRQETALKTWETYLPDQYELVKNYRLVTNGDWVLFVVSEHAETIEQIFNEHTA